MALLMLGNPRAAAQSTYVNFEGKQTNPVRLSPDGTRLFAVNTPGAQLSVFDLSNPSNPILVAEIPVGLEPVSVNPLSNDEAWVVNEVSDSVSVVSVSRGIVTDTLHAKDEPMDVVFAAGRAFVSGSRNNVIHVFDLATRTKLETIPVLGHNPRALAVSPDGAKVYAAFALSGNRTTLIPHELAPPQPMPLNIANPPPRTALIVDAASPDWSHVIKFAMPDNDAVEIDAATMKVNRYFSGLGTVNLGLAVNPRGGDLFVANTEARNLVRYEPNVRGRAVDNRLTRVSIMDGAAAAFDLNPGVDYTLFPNPEARAKALAQPAGLAFDPGGDFLYLAAFGTDRIAKVDINGKVLARIEVGPAAGAEANPRAMRGPRGLALNASARRLYALNRLANSLSVIDTASDSVLREIPVGSFDPTPAFIREGRGFLYDAKLSGNGTMSCASCHVDAEMDMLAWDLGDPSGLMERLTVNTFFGQTYSTNRHPMKGPMTTQTLRGLRGLDPLHWRGDRSSFLAFNGAFSSLLGGTALSNEDMIAYRNFINSIVFQPNPNQNLDRTLPARFADADPIAGKDTYLNRSLDVAPARCITCHKQNPGEDLPAGAGSNRQIFADQRISDPQHIKTPHLRNLYQKFGYTNSPGAVSIAGFGYSHDGRDSTLFNHFVAQRFGNLTGDTPEANQVKSNLVALLLCFDTGSAPAVGYARTITAANLNAAGISDDWSLLERQASRRFSDPFILSGSVTNISLIASGTIDGQRRRLLYRSATANYLTETTGIGPFTRAELESKIRAGDTLTFMGAPPSLAVLLSTDRTLNGVPDGNEAPPVLAITRADGNLEISWPSDAPAYLLEFTDRLSPPGWRPETSPRTATGGQTHITIPPSNQTQFFRLRRL